MRQDDDRRRSPRDEDNEAQLDELGNDPSQVGPRSAGQSGDPQSLSQLEDVADQSVEELADTAQALEHFTEALRAAPPPLSFGDRPIAERYVELLRAQRK